MRNLINILLVLLCSFGLSVCRLKLTKVLSFSVLIFILSVMGSIFVAAFVDSARAYLFTDYLQIIYTQLHSLTYFSLLTFCMYSFFKMVI